jgi:2-keto-4-pentenoate hydratase
MLYRVLFGIIFAANTAFLQAHEPNSAAALKPSPAVVFSHRFELSVEKAYQLQKAYVRNAVAKGAVEVGYKAGLTTQAAQQRYQSDGAISGVLLQPPVTNQQKKPVFLLKNSYHLMLELELAYRLNRVVNKQLSMDELQAAVAEFAPAIELPDVSFTQTGFSALDIIANNALAHDFFVGPWQKDVSQINALESKLYCGDTLLAKGLSSNVQGDQWQALLWLVNQLVAEDITIRPEHVLLTGTFIPLVPAKACAYRAEFGSLEALHFTVQ